jgi:hypothetical protein
MAELLLLLSQNHKYKAATNTVQKNNGHKIKSVFSKKVLAFA